MPTSKKQRKTVQPQEVAEENSRDQYVRWSDLEAAFQQFQQGGAPSAPPETPVTPIRTRRKTRAGRVADVAAGGAGSPGAAPGGPTRERILVAAAQVLTEKGYAGTRLADIAEITGLQAPAIYYYFPSREELIEEVMSVGQVRLREHVEQALAALPTDVTPMDRICAAIAAHLEAELSLSEFATAVIRNGGQGPKDARDRIRDVGTAYATLWRTLLADAQAAGQIRDDIDLRVARLLVLGALNWTAEWWHAEKGPLDHLIYAAQMLVRDGLGAKRR